MPGSPSLERTDVALQNAKWPCLLQNVNYGIVRRCRAVHVPLEVRRRFSKTWDVPLLEKWFLHRSFPRTLHPVPPQAQAARRKRRRRGKMVLNAVNFGAAAAPAAWGPFISNSLSLSVFWHRAFPCFELSFWHNSGKKWQRPEEISCRP